MPTAQPQCVFDTLLGNWFLAEDSAAAVGVLQAACGAPVEGRFLGNIVTR